MSIRPTFALLFVQVGRLSLQHLCTWAPQSANDTIVTNTSCLVIVRGKRLVTRPFSPLKAELPSPRGKTRKRTRCQRHTSTMNLLRLERVDANSRRDRPWTGSEGLSRTFRAQMPPKQRGSSPPQNLSEFTSARLTDPQGPPGSKALLLDQSGRPWRGNRNRKKGKAVTWAMIPQ